MSGFYKPLRPGLIRVRTRYRFLFFGFWLFLACHYPNKPGIAIRWQGQRATGIFIPNRFIPPGAADSLNQLLSVRLTGKETALLGHYRLLDDAILFEPLIPLTRGLRYTIWLSTKRLGELTVPALAPGDRPTLRAIYPSQDSLPANLLKIYLHFSRPMQEGHSQRYVALVKNEKDTLPGVFLNLQPELWNADRTLLTLWMDPGRIKRDLHPNRLLGAPLQTGVRYQVVVSATWPDEQGAALAQITKKAFLTVNRDSLSPNPARWTIHPPPAGRADSLNVVFDEALDFSLLTETLRVLDEAGNPVRGEWQLGDEEKQGWFKPDAAWKPGRYRLRVEGRLEDLAGNNLNRPFDRDVTGKAPTGTAQPYAERFFSVR